MRALTLLIAASVTGCVQGIQPGTPAIENPLEGESRRMPAEWEPQAAVWLQWPQAWEGQDVELAFANIVTTLSDYEEVHLVVNSEALKASATDALADADMDRVTFHVWAGDSSWMRDFGPRYLEIDGELIIQNWEFDAWGRGAWSDVPYDNDNANPDRVAEYLELRTEQVNITHERGDLEVNGLDTAIVNWSVLSHRNPQMPQSEMTTGLKQALGVDSVVYVQGFFPSDGTRGHVDGMVRFVSEDTVLVAKDGSRLMERVAEQIAEQRPDLIIERLESPQAALLLNFLVGDGYVLVGDSGIQADNAMARTKLQQTFPGREVRFVNIDALWANGGGIHCVTNDQPELSTEGR
jgi:agmatine deiminase